MNTLPPDNSQPELHSPSLPWARDLALALIVFFLAWAFCYQFQPFERLRHRFGVSWPGGLLAAGAITAVVMLIIALRRGYHLSREVHRRALVEARLQSAQSDFQNLFRAHPNPILIFDPDTRHILAVNDVATRFYGHPRRHFHSLRLDDLAWDPTPSTSRIGHTVEAVAERHRTAEGRMLEVELEMPLQELEWRGRRARAALVRDVTERRAAERRAGEAAEQLRLLLESTAEAIYALDREGRCLWANPAAARIFAFPTPKPMIGQIMHNLIHHTREDGTPFPVEACHGMDNLEVGRGVVQPNELLWRADGTSFRAEVRVNPIAENGVVTGAVVALSDITERLHLEEQFRQAQKMEAVGRLAAGVAHDFNNLLTVINGHADLLEVEAAGSPSLQRRARSIAAAGHRAAKLTGQLLAFSRQQVLHPGRLDLNTVVAQIEPMLRQIVSEQIELRLRPAPALPLVLADAGQLELALMNLVSNARDAGAARVELRTATARVPMDAEPAGLAPGDYVTLAVRDDGVGMDAATQDHIFEPFFTTKPTGKGTGLGLAAVFGMARQSGGAITVASEPGAGTTMTLFLPVFTGASVLSFPPPPADAAASAPHPAAAPATILVVEDDAAVRQFAVELLRTRGYDVLEAATPSDAPTLAADRERPIHLLLTDIVMPGMSGRELASRLRVFRPDLPVIYMSGYAGGNAGTPLRPDEHFLAKPFTSVTLAAAIDAALATAQP